MPVKLIIGVVIVLVALVLVVVFFVKKSKTRKVDALETNASQISGSGLAQSLSARGGAVYYDATSAKGSSQLNKQGDM